MPESADDPSAEDRSGDTRAPKVELNPDGSLVEIEPGSWFVGFVPQIEREWWSFLAHETHKHCFALRPAGRRDWIVFESWWRRVLVATIDEEAAAKYLRWGHEGDVLLVREEVPGRSNQVRIWVNCANLIAHMLGRAYWVWTPHGLYRRLQREPGTCHVDTSVLLGRDLSEIGSDGSRVVRACGHCLPETQQPGRRGTERPFCMKCGRELET